MSTRTEFLKRMGVGMVTGPVVLEALAPVVVAPPVAVGTYGATSASALDERIDRIFNQLWDSWSEMELEHSAL